MPENSSVNNTTQLSSGGGVGVSNFKNYTSRMIDAQVSRGNYRSGIKNDAQLRQFRDTVYKMVSTWLYEDKIRIVSEYGDSELLKKNPSEKKLNEICTESLIVHLPENDLNQLVKKVRSKESKLRREVQVANNNRERAGKTAFNPMSWQEMFDKQSDGRSTKRVIKDIRKIDKTYKIPAYMRSQFRNLERELRSVIRECYNKVTLATLGFRMGLDLNVNEKDLTRSIINKVILYAALVSGKGKNELMRNAIMDPEPYNEILQYTSYSYLTGKPGLSPYNWRILRNNAREAKRSIETRNRMKNQRKSRFSSEFNAISGGNRSSKSIKENDNGILKDASVEELLSLAGTYGIRPSKDIGKLKFELYRAIAANNKNLDKARAAASKATTAGKIPDQSILDDIRIRSSGVYSKDTVYNASDQSGTPVVRFNKAGERIDNFISRAVPVYIVGSGKTESGNSLFNLSKARTNDNGNIIGNSADTARKRIDTLSGNSLIYFNTIMGYSETELAAFETGTLVDRYYIKRDIITANTKRSDYMRRAYDIWFYAKCKKDKTLEKYAVTNMGVKPYNNYIDRSKKAAKRAATVGLATAGLAGLGAAAILNPVGTGIGLAVAGAAGLAIGTAFLVRKTARLAKGELFDDLPAAAQDFYYKEMQIIDNIGIEAYANSRLVKYSQSSLNSGTKNKKHLIGVSRESLAEVGITSSEKIKKIYVMLYAFVSGQKLLAKYLSKETGVSPKNFARSRRSTALQGIKDFFTTVPRALKAVFGKGGKQKKNTDSTLFASPEEAISSSTETTSTGIPLVRVDKNGETSGEVNRAVPVYIVGNNGSSNMDGILNNTNFNGADGTFANANSSIASGENSVALNILTGNNSLALKGDMVKDISRFISDSGNELGIKNMVAGITLSTYAVNSQLDEIPKIRGVLESILSKIEVQNLGIAAISPATAAAVGAGEAAMTAKNTALAFTESADALKNAKVATGAVKISRFASGGTAAITGDALGSNIFANGAKPELVQSSGSMSVTPLNKAGTATKQNINRMTLSQRSSSMATAITSHVVKLSYNLPSSVQDVSNPGEAIKVYNVKAGIEDSVDLGNGQSASLIGLVASIYTQLATIAGLSQTNGSVLNLIASNTSKIGHTSQSGTVGGNPFAGGFPSSLDGILSGE